MANTFHQLNAANNSGDYLTLKKSREFQKARFKAKTPNNFENNLLSSKGYIENSYDKKFPIDKTKAIDCVEESGKFTAHAKLPAVPTVNPHNLGGGGTRDIVGEYITFLGAHKHLGTRKIQTYNAGTHNISVIPPLPDGSTDNNTHYVIGRPLTYPYSKITIDITNKLSF
tara:strand:+ start:752 stop:1261 length:510 start_codon:yes stop_codon:yes gene_type:complete